MGNSKSPPCFSDVQRSLPTLFTYFPFALSSFILHLTFPPFFFVSPFTVSLLPVHHQELGVRDRQLLATLCVEACAEGCTATTNTSALLRQFDEKTHSVSIRYNLLPEVVVEEQQQGPPVAALQDTVTGVTGVQIASACS